MTEPTERIDPNEIQATLLSMMRAAVKLLAYGRRVGTELSAALGAECVLIKALEAVEAT